MRPHALFIHSTGATPMLWSALPDSLTRDATIVQPPNLGYPPLPLLERGTSTHALDDARHLQRQLPPDGPVHLFAHSYGGLVAFELAKLLGARVESMCLYEPVLFGPLWSTPDAEPAARAEAEFFEKHPWFLDDEARGGSDAWLELFIDYWNRPGAWARFPERQKTYTRMVSWKMFQEVRSCARDYSSFAEAKTEVPLTLIEGERSPAAPKAMVKELLKVNPHAVVHPLEGTGHMGPLTHPKVVVEALEAHWARVRPK